MKLDIRLFTFYLPASTVAKRNPNANQKGFELGVFPFSQVTSSGFQSKFPTSFQLDSNAAQHNVLLDFILMKKRKSH